MLKNILFNFGKILAIIYPHRLSWNINQIIMYIYSGYKSKQFSSFGKHSTITPVTRNIFGAKYIKIGDNVTIGKGVTLSAWDKYLGQRFKPSLVIGNNSSVGDHSHITTVNSIKIGNNVRMGKKILITDNAHGASSFELLDIAPNKRPLFSKGPVIIDDNVWIGEKSSIMPGVHVGKGVIIAANSVVTKDVPSYCVVAGVPAIVIKKL